MDDLISRQAAIDAYGDWYVEEGTEEGFIGTVKQLLEGLPSAQTDAPDTNVGDIISRQAAVAEFAIEGALTLDEIRERKAAEDAARDEARAAKEKSIPYEEYRLTFDHVMHTEDGKIIRIGFPLRCKMCALIDSDKRLVAMETEKLFEKMREAVMREGQDG